MRRMLSLKSALACAIALLAARCAGSVRQANVSGLCRGPGNELTTATETGAVDGVFEAGVAADAGEGETMTTRRPSKIDELLRLSREREAQLVDLTAQVSNLSAVVAQQSKQIAEMRPTVDQMAILLTFGRVTGTLGRIGIRLGLVVLPILWWMDGRWHLVSQLIKRAP